MGDLIEYSTNMAYISPSGVGQTIRAEWVTQDKVVIEIAEQNSFTS